MVAQDDAPVSPRGEVTHARIGEDGVPEPAEQLLTAPAEPDPPVPPTEAAAPFNSTPRRSQDVGVQVAPDGLEAPDMTLGRATAWVSPLGTPQRDYSLGNGPVHLTWHDESGIQALEQRGRLLGWIELYDNQESWVALIDGRLVAGTQDGIP